ncbi:MAG: hypothetical protein U5K28_07920 [Halobacteriales archaeon]|nr:hypothetical protein [Halobacteriales archaeon]
MTLAYFMQTAGSDVFGKRDVVVIDEAHGLAEWAEMYATIDSAPDTRPGLGQRYATARGRRTSTDAERLRRTPARRPVTADRRSCRRHGELTAARGRRTRPARTSCMRRTPVVRRGRPRPRDSATTWVVDQPDGRGTSAITIKPLDPARYLHHTVWERGEPVRAALGDDPRQGGVLPSASASTPTPSRWSTYPTPSRSSTARCTT